MAKYYIRCGELERIVLAENPRDACDKAIDLSHGETIDPYNFAVDERGYRGGKFINGCYTADTDVLEPEWLIPTDEVIATFGFDNEYEESYE